MVGNSKHSSCLVQSSEIPQWITHAFWWDWSKTMACKYEVAQNDKIMIKFTFATGVAPKKNLCSYWGIFIILKYVYSIYIQNQYRDKVLSWSLGHKNGIKGLLIFLNHWYIQNQKCCKYQTHTTTNCNDKRVKMVQRVKYLSYKPIEEFCAWNPQ